MFAKVFKCFFIQVFYKYVASVVSNILVVFRHVLQEFYLNVANVVVATHMLQVYVPNSFRHMLQQVLYVASIS
jgi:hypothetical protein